MPIIHFNPHPGNHIPHVIYACGKHCTEPGGHGFDNNPVVVNCKECMRSDVYKQYMKYLLNKIPYADITCNKGSGVTTIRVYKSDTTYNTTNHIHPDKKESKDSSPKNIYVLSDDLGFRTFQDVLHYLQNMLYFKIINIEYF